MKKLFKRFLAIALALVVLLAIPPASTVLAGTNPGDMSGYHCLNSSCGAYLYYGEGRKVTCYDCDNPSSYYVCKYCYNKYYICTKGHYYGMP